jgi:hypothetical protein
MTRPNIIIDYLANRAERADELARISWTEWRSIYEQRGETFHDALRKYRERINIDHLPLPLVALAASPLEDGMFVSARLTHVGAGEPCGQIARGRR